MFAEQSPYSIYIDVATVNCLTSGSRHNRPPIEVCVSLNYSSEEWEERDKAKVRLGGEEQTVDYNWYTAPYLFKSISKQWTEISWCYFLAYSFCLLFYYMQRFPTCTAVLNHIPEVGSGLLNVFLCTEVRTVEGQFLFSTLMVSASILLISWLGTTRDLLAVL